MVEQPVRNRQVGGSSPLLGSNFFLTVRNAPLFLHGSYVIPNGAGPRKPRKPRKTKRSIAGFLSDKEAQQFFAEMQRDEDGNFISIDPEKSAR
jgi:hypothetical protein